jgi:hypothetical protein
MDILLDTDNKVCGEVICGAWVHIPKGFLINLNTETI